MWFLWQKYLIKSFFCLLHPIYESFIVNRKVPTLIIILPDVFFEHETMPTPTKSQNPIALFVKTYFLSNALK